ncbi:unc-89, partial [Symbiodinium pilosum]
LLSAAASRKVPVQEQRTHSINESLDIMSQAGSRRLLFEELREIMGLIEELCPQDTGEVARPTVKTLADALPGAATRLRPFQ